ncbi:MAG: hypothetical protein KAG84_08830, partial [Bacteroidales bacterium]|nr:hypothetical protein [Bacteroidales bacterium]
KWRLSDFEDIESGVEGGILLSFKNDFKGTVIYGLYPDEPMEYANAVFFKRHIEIKDGKAFINIAKNLSGVYDMANWESKGKSRIRYRVLDDKNYIITNKNVAFSVKDNMFSIETSITAGPFITALTPTSLTITFWTNRLDEASLTINSSIIKSKKSKKHVFKIDNLKAAKEYKYVIGFPNEYFESKIKTAPNNNADAKFSFAFASDSRGGAQLGESNLGGHNAYIMRKMAALITYKDIDFLQFTGDMIDGYQLDNQGIRLEYTNWLRTMSPYMHSMSMNVGMGNHEAFLKLFGEPSKYIAVDNYPFETMSAEAVFADYFENPSNGNITEDGSSIDPNDDKIDFPSYDKNLYSYTYGNTAMIVLNSNYWYTPNHRIIPHIGGNAHGYIMDNQLEWLRKQILDYENDKNIKHVFVTIHTPVFPNGGHAKNDMWYGGNNEIRPYANGKAAKKGIIEQRDEFLDILVNRSSKFRVLLTGDEHNYTRLHIDNNSKIYPDDWKGDRIKFDREFVQIVNGAAGAPYYAQEKLPWSSDLEKFSSQYALVVFNINGDEIEIEVFNPDTLELIEKYKLK